ncbi:unnamed protein product [Effrenium voratum]|nr:unnamed protein product [Effrenium voratum]
MARWTVFPALGVLLHALTFVGPTRLERGLRPARAEPKSESRRNFFLETLSTPSPASALFGALGLGILFVLTREEKARKAKICVRSQQYIEDYLADPDKTARLAAKGVPYESMRLYLQDPDCLELSAYVDRVRTAKAFWEVGEEYRVG